MKPNLQPLLQLFALFMGLWCALPVFAQETLESDSCEDGLLLDDCTASEKCCEQAAPIRALLLTIARCNVDPEPDAQFCETLPHALPKSVLSYILSFEAAKNLQQHPADQRFFVAGHTDHHPIPSTQLPHSADDRGLGEWLLQIIAPFYIKLGLPTTTQQNPLLAGFYHLPETPG